ncbi:MAG: hypothetical protein ACRC4M_04055 [Mycoplasma sp.]
MIINSEIKERKIEIERKREILNKELKSLQYKYTNSDYNSINNIEENIFQIGNELRILNNEEDILEEIEMEYYNKNIKNIYLKMDENFVYFDKKQGIIEVKMKHNNNSLSFWLDFDDVRKVHNEPNTVLCLIQILKKYKVVEADYDVYGIKLSKAMKKFPTVKEVTKNTQS